MLTQAQIDHFRKNGFLHIPNALGEHEIQAVQAAADRLIYKRETIPTEWKKDYKFGALVGDKIEEGDTLCRIEYSLEKSPVFIELLGHPMIIGTALSLYDGPILLTWEDFIIKLARAGMGVPFHQDTLYQSLKSTVFSIGVYFDDSDQDPLYALPGTQMLGPLSEEEVLKIAHDRKDELVSLPVKAGDLLLHNVQMIHGSGANYSEKTRRVLYFEFRTINQVLEDSPWGEEWLKLRLPYISHAFRKRSENSMLAQEDQRFDLSFIQKNKERWEYQNSDFFIQNQNINLRVPHIPEEFELMLSST